MITFLRKRISLLAALIVLLATSASWGQTSFMIERGMNASTTTPTGVEFVSYDGATTWCPTASNGANAVTTFVIRAAPGYNLNVTSITGTGVTSTNGPQLFNFQVINNGTVNGTQTAAPGASNCSLTQQIATLNVPEQNRLVTSGNTITVKAIRAPGAYSGLGYSHMRQFRINGTVTMASILPPAVTTTQILPADITANSAIAGGNVTADNGAAVSARGTVYATTANPIIASSLTTNGTGTGIFTSNLASLSPNTQYYYRAYATNSNGTEYGDEYSFWTHANTPGAPVTSNPSPFSLDVALDVNGNPANTLYAITINGGGNTNMYVAANGNLTDTIVWLTAAQWGALVNIDVLQPNTAYTFDTAAQNGAGVQTPWSTTGTGTTAALAGPTTLTLINNTIDFEPACLSTDPNGAIGMITFNATNLSGQGLGIGDVSISGPNGAALEGISFSGTIDGTFDDGGYLIEDILEGADQTVYVRFDPTAGVSYGTITFEIKLVDPMNNTAAPLTVEVVIVDLPEAAATQTVCNGATVAELLTTSGTNIRWYAAATGGTALASTEGLTTQTYYASQSIGECESARIPVAVTVNPIPAVPVAAAQAFCGTATVSQLVVTTGTAPKWYAAENGGTELAGTEAIVTGNYYVSQTVNGCESPRAAVAVTVNAIPALPVAVAQSFCGAAAVANLVITTGESPKWYAAETGGNVLAATEAVTTGTYYVSQTVNGCESPRFAVAITVNTIPAAPVAQPVQLFCTAATVAELEATGEGILWYTTATGGTALAETTAITAGTSIYYASQTVNGCESIARSAVAVNVTVAAAPSASAQEFCNAATVSQLVASGTALEWYADETGGTALADSDSLETATYYVTQTINGCESPRTAVAVTLNAIPDAPTAAAQSFCGNGFVSQLVVTTGANIQWYAAATGGTALASNAILTTGNYYASQTVNGCESVRALVAVTVNTLPAIPATTPLDFCTSATAGELTATGENLQWYTAATGGSALEDLAAVQSGIYYVSQTVNGCESVRTAVEVTVTEVAAPIGENEQEFEAGETLADLVVEGENIAWYAEEDLTTPLPETTVLTDGVIYYAVATQGNCMSEVLDVLVHEVLDREGFDEASLRFFPNPVNDVLNLTYNEIISGVEVYNLLGQPVISKEFNTAEVLVDLSSLAAGNYIVKVTSDNSSATIKVVKR